jgi:hypothetical protein
MLSLIQASVTGGRASISVQFRARGFMPKMTPVFRRLPEVAIKCPSMEVNFAYLAARSRKDKGEIAACRNCGSRSVGVHLYESDWTSGGAFRVVLECPHCEVGAGDFIISNGEARGCGLDPDADLVRTSETGP